MTVVVGGRQESSFWGTTSSELSSYSAILFASQLDVAEVHINTTIVGLGLHPLIAVDVMYASVREFRLTMRGASITSDEDGELLAIDNVIGSVFVDMRDTHIDVNCSNRASIPPLIDVLVGDIDQHDVISFAIRNSSLRSECTLLSLTALGNTTTVVDVVDSTLVHTGPQDVPLVLVDNFAGAAGSFTTVALRNVTASGPVVFELKSHDNDVSPAVSLDGVRLLDGTLFLIDVFNVFDQTIVVDIRGDVTLETSSAGRGHHRCA